MKIKKLEKINESKEKKITPEDNFITSFVATQVAEGWQAVNYFTEQINLLKTMRGTNKLVDIMQGVRDTYFIYVGQLESYLKNKDLIEIPKEKEADKKLKEDINISLDNSEDKIILKNLQKDDLDLEDDFDLNQVTIKKIEKPVEHEVVKEPIETPKPTESKPISNTEYFVDFDEPAADRPLTDADLYDENGKIKL